MKSTAEISCSRRTSSRTFTGTRTERMGCATSGRRKLLHPVSVPWTTNKSTPIFSESKIKHANVSTPIETDALLSSFARVEKARKHIRCLTIRFERRDQAIENLCAHQYRGCSSLVETEQRKPAQDPQNVPPEAQHPKATPASHHAPNGSRKGSGILGKWRIRMQKPKDRTFFPLSQIVPA